MKRLRLDELLRYAFSGGVSLIVLVFTYPCAMNFSRVQGVGGATLVVGVALLVGSLTYVFHRALIFPLVYRLALLFMVAFGTYSFQRDLLCPFRLANLEVELDSWRWRVDEKSDSVSGRVGEWSAQVHFLYCSAWAVLFGLVVGRFSGSADPTMRSVFLLSSLMLGVAAIVHHLRLLHMISKLTKAETQSKV